ncbi:acetyl-CoA C-acetyltransferase [Brevibacillus nitrificans]|uniref:acetyl-CoA C-acetyltransferase n=1 Tax=Brevibacillus nitrificans TaxID=651560 RepID=UPI002614D934|nr:acetyl-CoA C-acetyltransferase [Brevibacillus nitrificans]MED1795750.1 acetyl-CoA C-acetyltransferase [Brevibacillus nitrificans]
MNAKDIVIVDGARTAFTKFGGSFREISAIDLGAIAAKEALSRSKVDAGEIDHVIFGNVIQSSPDAVLAARHVGLKAGIPQEVPALTINRLCGSGLEAITQAARMIMTGEAEMVLAGGSENMSQIPHVIRGARWGIPLFENPMQDYLYEALYDTYGECFMTTTAENLAEHYSFTREELDRHALSSHEKALAAIGKGYFREEIVPVTVQERKESRIIDTDEHPRHTSLEKLRALSPSKFKRDGVVTPGNSSGINDGAAAVVVMSAEKAQKRGLSPIGRLVSWAVAGVDPKMMGIGPVPAIKQALQKAGMTVSDLDLIEINEAFSAQYLACQKELGFDPAIGNVNGGAIALGHPLAASGARISLSLLYELGRRGRKYGASALCIGGGQGIAAIWERL